MITKKTLTKEIEKLTKEIETLTKENKNLTKENKNLYGILIKRNSAIRDNDIVQETIKLSLNLLEENYIDETTYKAIEILTKENKKLTKEIEKLTKAIEILTKENKNLTKENKNLSDILIKRNSAIRDNDIVQETIKLSLNLLEENYIDETTYKEINKLLNLYLSDDIDEYFDYYSKHFQYCQINKSWANDPIRAVIKMMYELLEDLPQKEKKRK